MDEEEIELILDPEPKNEEHRLDESLGGVSDQYPQEMVYKLHSLGGGDEKEMEETLSIHGMDDYIEPSMLGCFLPWGSLLHGPRGTRMRRRSWKKGIAHIFGRKNNDHWTQDEVELLVEGVSNYGVGNWTQVKNAYFSTSIRTAVHLKDKWRNLVKGCKKKKGKMFFPVEQRLMERIRKINATDPYPKQSHA